MERKDRIIVALDVDSMTAAVALVEQLRAYTRFFKVGLQMIHAQGTPALAQVFGSMSGVGLMVDAKLDDIPNTVLESVKGIRSHHPKWAEFITMHTNAGRAAMKAAVAARGDLRISTKILAITVLTTISDEECIDMFGVPRKDVVMYRARAAAECGVDGVVCSGHEAKAIKERYPSLMAVVPGIRPKWAQKQDQENVMTPTEAFDARADYIVVGRPITAAPNRMSPVEAIQKIQSEL